VITVLILAAVCQQAPTLDADAGFQGTVFPDSWTRVGATLAYDGPELDVDLRITLHTYDSDPVVYRRPLKLLRKMRLRTGFDLYVTEYSTSVDVELASRDKVLSKKTLPLNLNRDEARRLLVVGSLPSIFVEAMAKKPPVTIVRLQPDQLPSGPLSLEGLDAILFPEPTVLDPGQEAALEEWVRRGGRLVFGLGRSTLLTQRGFWKDLCPLEAPETKSVAVPGKDGATSLTVGSGRAARGRGGFVVGDAPLMIRDRRGAGEVIFLPVILDQDALSGAVPAAAYLAEMLSLPPPPKDPVATRRGFVPRREEWLLDDPREGVQENVRRVLRCLMPLQWSVSASSLILGAGLLVAYVVLIGPVEFLRLRRSGRLRTGWRSLALLILLFGGLSYAWTRWAAPQQSRLMLVSLWDGDRVQTFGAFRPAKGDVYDLHAPGPVSPLGGSRAFGVPASAECAVVTYPFDVQVPIPPMDTRLFIASRSRSAGEARISVDWKDKTKKAIVVRNPTDLALDETWAVSREAVWPLGPISPGANTAIELEKPIPFLAWASRMVGDPPNAMPWWFGYGPWGRVPPAQFGALLTFCRAITATRTDRNEVYRLADRSLDWSKFLDAGEVVVIGRFSRNLSGLSIPAGPPPQVFGWVRLRVREAAP
jgi:hypothetical protein